MLQGDALEGEWYINGEQFPDVTVGQRAIGQDTVIEVRNLSATDHPFHIHGHHFEVLSSAGEVPTSQRLEDTWNVPARTAARFRFEAWNPGFWMVHCHILPHADGGMMTVLEVE